MIAVTLSSKYQLAIPKAIRDELGLYAGQKLALITKGSVIELIPLRSIEKSRGLLKGANPEGYRDRRDRYCDGSVGRYVRLDRVADGWDSFRSF